MASTKRKSAPSLERDRSGKKPKLSKHALGAPPLVKISSAEKSKPSKQTAGLPTPEHDQSGKKPKLSKSTPGATVLRQEEPAFPRGGASVLTPLEQKQIHIQAKNDVLFEQNTGKKAPRNEYEDEETEALDQIEDSSTKPKRKPRTKRKPDHVGQLPKEKVVRVEGLSYKRLGPGSLVLGQVSQINQYDIALSLPNNLTGYVPMTSMSDRLSKKVERLAEQEEDGVQDNGEASDSESKDLDLKSYFSVGQYLRASVVSTEKDSAQGTKGKRHIELSINPQHANAGLQNSDPVVNSMVQASVKSVEDHGLVMELGVGGDVVRGFMSSRELGPNSDISRVHEGAVYLCLVTGLSSNGNVVKLSADLQKAGDLRKGHFLTDAPTVDCFLPGTAVEFVVNDVTPSGVVGKAMGVFDMTADLIHSEAAAGSLSLDEKYSVGDKIKGRIICTFPDAEPAKVGISLLRHILSFETYPTSKSPRSTTEPPTEALPISTIVAEARVARVEPGLGLFVDLGVKGVRGYVHISRITDGKIETLAQDSGPYRAGSVHKARVIGYNYMDGLYIVSMEPKIIAQPFLSIDDVQVGQLVKGTIQKILVNENGINGIIVSISEGITGLVPEIHFSDIHLQHPERKFKEGASVTARVLSKVLAKRQLRLTLKKALVNSDDGIWQSYDALEIGAEAPGTIINITASGAIVQFYGPVRGFLPVSQMSESYIDDPKKHFRAGQVVKVRIVSVDPTECRMIVSCKTPSVFDTKQQEHLQTLAIGSFVSGTVSEKTNDEIILEVQESGLKAMLPFEHLTDGSAQKAAQAAKKIRVGQEMKELIVLNKTEGKRLLQLSSKPSLLKAARSGRLVRSFEDIQEGAEVDGFVNNVTSTGIFVHFAGGTAGLLLKTQLPDEALSKPDFGMRKNQSISALVLSVDHAQQRFLLTMKLKSSTNAPVSEKKVSKNSLAEGSLFNPVDEVSTSIDDFTVGKLTKARINSVKETQLNVQLANGVQGRIDVSMVFDNLADIKNRKNPLKSFRPKQVLSVRVLGVHDSRNHRFLPISHRGKAPVIELTTRPKDLESVELEILTVEKVQVNSVHVVFVSNVSEDSIWVNLSPNVRGRIRALDLSDDVSLLTDMAKNFPVGSALKAKVTNVDVANNRLDFTARLTSAAGPLTFDDLSVGMVLPGRVTKVNERQVMVQLNEKVSGSVNLVDIADDYSKADPTIYEKNQIIRVCVKHVDAPNKKILLSTRPSRVLSSSLPVEDREINATSDVAVNDILQGFVKNVASSGVFISLGSNVTAFVRVSDLSDLYLKDWKSHFEIDQLVKGKIIEVDAAVNHIQMSLKQSHIDKDYKPPLTFNDVTVGQVVTGKIRKVADFGVFVVVDNSANVSGLCHRTQMADGKVQDPQKLFEEGDVVKARVLKVDREKKRISLGLKASFFKSEEDVDEDEEVDDTILDAMITNGRADSEDSEVDKIEEVLAADNNEASDSWEGLDEVEDAASDVSMDDADDGGIAVNGDKMHGEAQQGLSAGGFDWEGGLTLSKDQEAPSETDDETSQPKKKKKRRAEIQIDRTGDLDAHGPQSVADFERLLLGQPNSSVLWLSYMAFQLQLSEVGLARAIGERALRTIHIREQGEKLNVWVAMLNLENTYGTDESVDAIFKRACQHCDSLDIHERLISIYIQSGQHEKADALFTATLSKHGSASPSLWLNAATFYLTTIAAPSRAHALLPRALQSFPQHTHVDLTRSFALLEYSSPNGDPERGRTLFENLLSTFPKKLDLWTVYADAEIKKADKERIRELFERVSKGQWKKKQMQFWFGKWEKWEGSGGDVGGKERVERLAEEWVRREAERLGKI
ncbi:MAG: hypothetical protein LQ346_006783 [Caloplaca aetnensis]|nr:MAG: hypothetical protein LQ346_006783 [Caloplaca aetnensis]